MQFLAGLNDQFCIVKTQILLLDPLPSLNKVYSLVIQEESNNSSPSSISISEDSTIRLNASEARKLKGVVKVLIPILRNLADIAFFFISTTTPLIFVIKNMVILASLSSSHV